MSSRKERIFLQKKRLKQHKKFSIRHFWQNIDEQYYSVKNLSESLIDTKQLILSFIKNKVLNHNSFKKAKFPKNLTEHYELTYKNPPKSK